MRPPQAQFVAFFTVKTLIHRLGAAAEQEEAK